MSQLPAKQKPQPRENAGVGFENIDGFAGDFSRQFFLAVDFSLKHIQGLVLPFEKWDGSDHGTPKTGIIADKNFISVRRDLGLSRLKIRLEFPQFFVFLKNEQALELEDDVAEDTEDDENEANICAS